MKEIKAKKGYYYRKGDTFGKTVCLPDSADPKEWKQVPESEYEEYKAEQEKNRVELEAARNKSITND